MSKVGLILMFCCILVCNGQLDNIVSTGSGVSPIDSDSDFNCYVGVKISSNFYNQNLQTVQPCNDNLNCASVSANIEQMDFGITVTGEVTYGLCVPSTACSNFSCDSLREQLAAMNQSQSDLPNLLDCTSSCCNTNLCNGPSESQTLTTDTVSSEIDNVDTSVQQGGTDAESDIRCYTGPITTIGTFVQNQQNITRCEGGLICLGVTGDIDGSNSGVLFSGSISLGQCVPRMTCSSITCDSIGEQLVGRSPGVQINIEDCETRCCDTDLCNKPTDETASPRNQIFTDGNMFTSVGQAVTEAMTSNAFYVSSSTTTTTTTSEIRCYNGPITTIGTFVQNQQNITRCEGGSICLEVTGDIDGSNSGILFSGSIIYGQCIPRLTCSSITCDSIGEQLVGRSPGVQINLEDCETRCCDTDLCNTPTDETASPRNQIFTDGSMLTSVGQTVTEAMTSQVVTSNVSSQSDGLCGSTIYLRAERQQISSPNYPANYPINQDCDIILRPSTPQSIVHIRFLVFRTERAFDYVEIYNNVASGSQRLSGFYANNSLNLNRTGEVTVKFYSDGSRNEQGFLADVYETRIIAPTTITSSENACGSTIRVTTEPQLISSPNYPENYPNRITCNLFLRPSTQESVIRIEFLRFDTESGYDYITFLQNFRRHSQYSGSRAPFNITRTGPVTLRFTSDGSRNKKGYLARIYEIPAGANETSTGGIASSESSITTTSSTSTATTAATTTTTSTSTTSGNTSSASTTTTSSGSCGSTIYLRAERQQIYSPNYPANYPTNQDCDIVLRPSTPQSIVHVRFLVFRTERSFDYVQIYKNAVSVSQRYTGIYANNSLSFNITGEVTVKFNSDGSRSDQGFLADVYETRIFEPTTTTSNENACGSTIRVTTEPQLISSPNYPENYPNRITCNLILQPSTQESVIRIEFLNFNTERRWDYLQFLKNSQPGFPYSGSRAPFNVTETGTVTLRFISDRSQNRKGYLARIYEIPAGANETSTDANTSSVSSSTTITTIATTTTSTTSGPCRFNRIATLTPQQISSPGWPESYSNNEECRWVLQAENFNSRIQIQFTDFTTELCCDHLKIYENDIERRKFSGVYTRDIYYNSNTNRIEIVFESDLSVTRGGFNGTFRELRAEVETTAAVSTPEPRQSSCDEDLNYLPSCTVKQAIQAVFRCEYIFAYPNIYEGRQTCKNEVDQAIRCVTKQLIQCGMGGGENRINMLQIPNLDLRTLLRGLSYFILDPSFQGNLNIDSFCDHAERNSSFSTPVQAYFGFCARDSLDNLREMVKNFYFTFISSENKRQVCRAFQMLKRRFIYEVDNRCNLEARLPRTYSSGARDYIHKALRVAYQTIRNLNSTSCQESSDESLRSYLDIFNGTISI